MAETNFLRPEARAVPYWKHHVRARKALDFIIRALKEAAAGAAKSKHEPGDDSVDPNRTNRIVFISGEPGSGKSTLYLTLKAMLTSKDKGNFRVGCQSSFEELNEILWLDTLDLEVVGDDDENMLAAVLVRIFRKLEESNLHSKKCEEAIKKLEELATDIGIAWEGNLAARAGALDPDTFSTEVMRTQRARLRVNERLKEALDELSTNECYGCRAGTLFLLPVDDFYLKPTASLHLLRLLRMISIPRLFFLVMGDIDTVEALFIEKSLSDWTAVAGKELFIHQSDRLDHALSRAREMRARYLRKLLPPGQRYEIQPMDWHEALDLKVGSFQTNSELPEQPSLERILLDVGLDAPFAGDYAQPRSLLTFLISPRFSYIRNESIDAGKYKAEIDKPEYRSQKEKRETRAKDPTKSKEDKNEIELRKHRSAYTALQILDATPREMMDLGASLRAVERQRQEIKNSGTLDQDTKMTPLLLVCVRDIVNQVKEEQSFLTEKEQNVLEGILPTRHYAPRDITFEMERLRLRPSQRTWREFVTEQLWVRDQSSWDLTVNVRFMQESIDNSRIAELENVKLKAPKSKPDRTDMNEIEADEDNPFAKLPPRPAAWYVLLHDLAWSWNHESLSVNLVDKLCRDLNSWDLSFDKVSKRPDEDYSLPFKGLGSNIKLESERSKYFSGWAVWFDGSTSTYKHLPLPEFYTFREIDQFLHVWSRGLSWLRNAGADDVNALWTLAGWTILGDLYNNFAQKDNGWFDDFKGIKGNPNQLFKGFRTTLMGNLKEQQDELERCSAALERTQPKLESWGKATGWLKKPIRRANRSTNEPKSTSKNTQVSKKG